MTIRTTDTNPHISNEKIKEILRLEIEIDKHLLENLRNGKASYLMTSTKDVAEIIKKRYEKTGWTINIGYSSDFLFRFDFIDPDQTK